MKLVRATGVVFTATLFALSFSTSLVSASGPGETTIHGVMRYLEIEGGCWQFQADYGTTYEPFGGDETLYLDGVSYTITGFPRPELESFCMVGTGFEVLDFEIDQEGITVAGIMHYIPLEGGCWQLISVQGDYYEPIFGDESLYRDGKRVLLKGIPRPGMISICMVGTLLVVTDSFVELCGSTVIPAENLESATLALIPILLPGLMIFILKKRLW